MIKNKTPTITVDINEKKLMMIFIIKRKGEQVYCSPFIKI
jgi:hypothetical protein